MLKKLVAVKNKIWGDEDYACNIGFRMSPIDGKPRYYAECESTLGYAELSERNCEDVLNDMFYDYCVENASYMGVS